MRVLQAHVISSLGHCEEKNIAAPAQMMKRKALPKSLGYLALLHHVQKREKLQQPNSVKEVERYFEEDPLMHWKKKSEKLPTLAVLGKEYLGLTATYASSERRFSIAENFYTARRNLLGTDTFRNLMFMKCNSNLYDNKVKL